MQDWGATDHVRAVAADATAHPDRLLGAIAMLAAARECLDEAEADLVSRARAEGLTWREIATAMSLGSPQAAAQRAHRRPPRIDDHVPAQQRQERHDRAGELDAAGSQRSKPLAHRRALRSGSQDGAAR